MTPANAVQITYTVKNANTSTGEWQLSGLSLILPSSSYVYAYTRAKLSSDILDPLPLSAKRRKYSLPPAATLRDFLEERSFSTQQTGPPRWSIFILRW